MNYIHIETGEYPLTESQLLQRFKDISFPEGVFEPEGYALVTSSEPPVFDHLTQNLREASPERTPEGWQQRWEIYPLPAEEVAANQAAAAQAAREQAKAQRQAAVDAIKVTTQAGHTFDGDETSQTRMTRAVLAMQATGTPSVTWVLADNTVIQATVPELTEALALAGAEQARLWVIE